MAAEQIFGHPEWSHQGPTEEYLLKNYFSHLVEIRVHLLPMFVMSVMGIS